ncbi:hypothetical protein [Conexibacter sp. S30A1]|uniref:hypothetical protein n=1 Tax=Conexibacter sp. S30A1 TaxID=2937800 RepID=UPI0020107BF4|nr:hypothetical protein [Conexibacter sp. S30A1]
MKVRTSRQVIAGALGVSGAVAALALGGGSALAAKPMMTPPMPAPGVQGQLSRLHEMAVGSTVATNGDTNPYGVAVVPLTSGKLVKGDVLVANFNNSAGTAGAGTTIVEINPTTGQSMTFFQGKTTLVGPVAIAINPTNDIVWVGDYGPANATSGAYDGSAANVDVILPNGTLKYTFNAATTDTKIFSGVWGQAFAAINGKPSFIWTNVGDGTTGMGGGTVWQLTPGAGVSGQPLGASYTELASGLPYNNMPGTTAATAAGPQGTVYDPSNSTLYVTNDYNNTIDAITGIDSVGGPMTTTLVSGGALNTPQGIAINPANGDLLVVNGAGNNDLLEYTPMGQLVASRDLLPNQAPGALFGIAATMTGPGQMAIYFGDDDNNMLYQLTGPMGGPNLPAVAR